MNDEDIIDLFFDRKESAIFETDNKYGNHLSKLAMRMPKNAKMILILRPGTPFHPLAPLIFLPI